MHFKLREEGVEIRCGGLQLGRLATSGIGFAATQVFRRDRGGIEQPRLVDPTAKSSRVASQAAHLHLRQHTEIRRATVCTPVTNATPVCRHLLAKQTTKKQSHPTTT